MPKNSPQPAQINKRSTKILKLEKFAEQVNVNLQRSMVSPGDVRNRHRDTGPTRSMRLKRMWPTPLPWWTGQNSTATGCWEDGEEMFLEQTDGFCLRWFFVTFPLGNPLLGESIGNMVEYVHYMFYLLGVPQILPKRMASAGVPSCFGASVGI